MTQIMREQREIPSFVKHLSAFTKSERGGVLQRVGGSHTPRFRFTNPLLRPYVVFRGVEEGLVKEAGAYQHSEPEVARQLSLFTAVPSDDA